MEVLTQTSERILVENGMHIHHFIVVDGQHVCDGCGLVNGPVMRNDYGRIDIHDGKIIQVHHELLDFIDTKLMRTTNWKKQDLQQINSSLLSIIKRTKRHPFHSTETNLILRHKRAWEDACYEAEVPKRFQLDAFRLFHNYKQNRQSNNSKDFVFCAIFLIAKRDKEPYSYKWLYRNCKERKILRNRLWEMAQFAKIPLLDTNPIYYLNKICNQLNLSGKDFIILKNQYEQIVRLKELQGVRVSGIFAALIYLFGKHNTREANLTQENISRFCHVSEFTLRKNMTLINKIPQFF